MEPAILQGTGGSRKVWTQTLPSGRTPSSGMQRTVALVASWIAASEAGSPQCVAIAKPVSTCST
jgi:hypothetical protein